MEHYLLWESPAGYLALVARGEKLVAVVFKGEREQVLATLHTDFPRITSYNVCYTKLLRSSHPSSQMTYNLRKG